MAHHHIDVSQLTVASVSGGSYNGLVDQTVDASIVAIRNEQAQQQMQQNLNKVVDGHPQPLAAPNGQAAPDHHEEKVEEKHLYVSDKIIYNSINRSTLYYATAWLWCGCFEPKYKITADYVIGEEWYGCTRETDSMAFENVGDISRSQPCCYSMLSCCCPCINDMGNIVLLGGDDSHQHGWKLKRLHRSTKVYEVLVKTIQATNSNFKKQDKK